MFTYSLAWDTAFNTNPTESAAFYLLQYCKRAQKVLKTATEARLDHVKVNCKIC